MKQSDHFIENADNCAQLADGRLTNQRISVTDGWKQPGERLRGSKIGSTARRLLYPRPMGMHEKGRSCEPGFLSGCDFRTT
jgi:hypothetical protein